MLNICSWAFSTHDAQLQSSSIAFAHTMYTVFKMRERLRARLDDPQNDLQTTGDHPTYKKRSLILHPLRRLLSASGSEHPCRPLCQCLPRAGPVPGALPWRHWSPAAEPSGKASVFRLPVSSADRDLYSRLQIPLSWASCDLLCFRIAVSLTLMSILKVKNSCK